MTLDELQDLLDRCGGDPGTWPASARAGAQRLLANSRQAQSLLEAQQRVDLWLSVSRRGDAVRTPLELTATATQAVQATSPPGWTRWAVAASAAILAATLGLVAGFAGPPQSPQVLAVVLSDQEGAFYVG